MSFHVPLATAAPAVAFLLAAPCLADVSAADPQGVIEALQAQGYRAQRDVDGAGDPMIRSATQGISFQVLFYGCTDGADCRSLQFTAGFDLEKGITLSAANDWNRDKRWGKAYLDGDGDPFLQMDIGTVGGLPMANFADLVDTWDGLVAQFKEHIDW